ncbi:hypothetical protein BJ944DRAFT_234072 [Cunninghamella echinulata]|nr:hypothetical protein BJ944DRAFT_234072 [Cunninghamella echinulata]
MKCFGLFIFTLWLVSMFVLAVEPEKEEDVATAPSNAETQTLDAQPLDAGRWKSCWWTDCSSHPKCHGDSYKKKSHHCGNHHHKKYYCCKEKKYSVPEFGFLLIFF